MIERMTQAGSVSHARLILHRHRLDNQVVYYKFLIKMNDLHEVQREMIKFLRNLGTIFPHELKSEFKKLHDRLIVFENHPYEKRAFLYLDIISWLESKIENKPVAEIIQEKAKKLIR